MDRPPPYAIKYGEFIGEHPSVKSALRLIERVATSTVKTVLIDGETGTGKGMVARMIHHLSTRKDQVFLDINCAAIPSTLLESELFGHERGAFTGAAAKKRGLIEIAHLGTVFLDDIREMDLPLQAKFLGVLDTQSFRPIGSVKSVEVDVRFIAATNKTLDDEVKSGNFREDLYYRLRVGVIHLPPLRKRGDDVFLLTNCFLDKFSNRYGRVIRGCDKAVEDIFRMYSWPGNVRELENLIERIFLLEDEDRILVKHLPGRILREINESQSKRAGQPHVPTFGIKADLTTLVDQFNVKDFNFREATNEFQRALISTALKRTADQFGPSAHLLGLTRHSLRYHMGRLNLKHK